MPNKRYLFLTLLLISSYAICLMAQNKPKDPYGKVDKAEVIIKQLKPNQFTLVLTWDNDEKLAAVTYPLLVKGKDFKMRYDSVSWKGRAEYFAVKSVLPKDSLNQVLVGLLADLTGANPPLKEDKGMLATLFFTAVPANAKKTVDICDITVDTTFMSPANTLLGVIQDGTGQIHPAYDVVKLGANGQPATCK